jgi:phospholipase/lecithinase/hemolysin
MHQFKSVSAILVSIIVSIILAGCGGGGGSDLPAKPKFSSQVSFGDSLSDVGSYRVGPIAAAGGGQFTINAASATPATPINWTELTAASLGLGACAASTGGFGVATTSHPGCFGYAQGGARVTDPAGVGNASQISGVFVGAMTVPVVQQIANHLAAIGNKFSGNELVLVMAGANDVFVQSAIVSASVASSVPPASAVASAVTAMQLAATQLAADVNTQIIGNGAKYVAVMNIPDIAGTPYAALTGSAALSDTLVTAFNAQLKTSLPDSASVLNVDAYAASRDEVLNPGKYLLTNVTTTACNLAAPSNPLASSLACNANNLNTGVSPTSHYLFADLVHPTPYGYELFATYVLQAMTNKGWY